MYTLGRIPAVADAFNANGFRVEVVDMDKNRVDKVLLTRIPSPALAGKN
jgi:putative hemolysin